MKTAEELNALKEEVETLKKKLAELTEEELKQVAGGGPTPPPWVSTDMLCQNRDCGYYAWWDGDFFEQIFDCPRCKQHTLKGIKKYY